MPSSFDGALAMLITTLVILIGGFYGFYWYTLPSPGDLAVVPRRTNQPIRYENDWTVIMDVKLEPMMKNYVLLCCQTVTPDAAGDRAPPGAVYLMVGQGARNNFRLLNRLCASTVATAPVTGSPADVDAFCVQTDACVAVARDAAGAVLTGTGVNAGVPMYVTATPSPANCPVATPTAAATTAPSLFVKTKFLLSNPTNCVILKYRPNPYIDEPRADGSIGFEKVAFVSGTPLQDSVWVNLALMFDSRARRISFYIDGTLDVRNYPVDLTDNQATACGSGAANALCDLVAYASNRSGAVPRAFASYVGGFDGYMKNASYYPRTMTDADIRDAITSPLRNL